MNDEGIKVSVDATKTLSNVNNSGPTAHIGATYVTVNMAMEKKSSLVDTTGLGSYPPLPKQVATSAGYAPAYGYFLGKRVAYPVVANYVRNTWGKYRLVRSMFSSSSGLFSFQFSFVDGLDAMLDNVWVKLYGAPVMAFSEDDLSAIATKLGTPLMLDSYTADMCMQSWGRSSYARAMIELRSDVELKDNIVVVMPKITREGYYTCNIHVEYEWKPPRCACCKVFRHVLKECPKNIGVGGTKNLKKTSQTPKGILVGQKLGFKPKQSTKEVSKSNPFEVLTSIDNDVDLGTNEGISNSADKGTINVSSSNTLIGEKIDKIERQICKGKLRFVDDDGNPLVPTGIVDSDSEVEVVFDETRDSYPDNDDYDPYDADMYKNHDMSEHLQSISDDLDITVRGRKKK
ncbi:hypothetical protein Tco_1331133 [Tanacetum coccineum]